MPPIHENYLESAKRTPQWMPGAFRPKINCAWGGHERAMSREIAVQAAEMLARRGARDISVS